LTAESAMAAAIAAAAELASQGGMSLFESKGTFAEEQAISTVSPESSNSGGEEREHFSVTSDSEKAYNDDSEGEEDAEKRLTRSRERNREHARRTRLRKKAHFDALQQKVKCLEAESRVLRQSIEECSIASILVGLSTNSNQHKVVDSFLDCSETKKLPTKYLSGKRKRFFSDSDTVERVPQPLKLIINGKTTFIGGGKTHINWKSGVYCDDVGVQRQLTQDQLESLRRERNRMHAKMTRDRKKCFIAAVEKTIEELEMGNQRMRETLTKLTTGHHAAVTPISSPVLGSVPTSEPPPLSSSADGVHDEVGSHGFSLCTQ